MATTTKVTIEITMSDKRDIADALQDKANEINRRAHMTDDMRLRELMFNRVDALLDLAMRVRIAD